MNCITCKTSDCCIVIFKVQFRNVDNPINIYFPMHILCMNATREQIKNEMKCKFYVNCIGYEICATFKVNSGCLVNFWLQILISLLTKSLGIKNH